MRTIISILLIAAIFNTNFLIAKDNLLNDIVMKNLKKEYVYKKLKEEYNKIKIAQSKEEYAYESNMQKAMQRCVSEDKLLIIWIRFKDEKRTKEELGEYIHFYQNEDYLLNNSEKRLTKGIIICKSIKGVCTIVKIFNENELFFDNVINYIPLYLKDYIPEQNNLLNMNNKPYITSI